MIFFNNERDLISFMYFIKKRLYISFLFFQILFLSISNIPSPIQTYSNPAWLVPHLVSEPESGQRKENVKVPQRILLLGPTHSGKTTIGKILQKKLGEEFVFLSMGQILRE